MRQHLPSIRQVAFAPICLYAFTVPWDVVPLSGIGTTSRVVGILAMTLGVLATAIEGRIRKLTLVVWLALAFAVTSAMSLLWTNSYDATLERVFTYIQLFGSLWVIQEFARTREEQRAILVALCLGIYVPLIDQLYNFAIGTHASTGRFTSDGTILLNANDLGLTLVLGMPISWFLSRVARGWVRAMALTYFAIAPLGVVLTASRGSFLAGVVALSIIPLTNRRWTVGFVSVAGLLAVIGFAIGQVVPNEIWTRIETIPMELFGGGNMSGRVGIWSAGLQLIPEHPLLGIGAGAYAQAMATSLGRANPAHNVLLDVTVEQGILGLAVFAALLTACVSKIRRLPLDERALWTVLAMSWFVGVMSLSWQAHKLTWLLFGLLAGRSEMARTSTAAAPIEAIGMSRHSYWAPGS